MKFHNALIFAVLAIATAAADPAHAGAIFVLAALATTFFAIAHTCADRAQQPKRTTAGRRTLWAASLATGLASMFLLAALIADLAVSVS